MVSERIRRAVPRPLRRRARSVRAYPKTFRVAGDLASFRRLRRLDDMGIVWSPTVRTVDLRVKPLGGASIAIRPKSSDIYVLWSTFIRKRHLPPELPDRSEPKVIWDLGSNIGLTVAHVASLYPDASVVGVELDESNVRLCERNIGPWSERCTVLQGAVWPTDGEVHYEVELGHEHGLRASSDPRLDGSMGASAPAYSLNTLLREHAAANGVDYVKMDIEGAEREVLRRNTEWARRVRVIKVEVHEPYSIDDCRADLERVGFTVTTERFAHGPVTGIREDF